jgi:hypothetical protein
MGMVMPSLGICKRDVSSWIARAAVLKLVEKAYYVAAGLIWLQSGYSQSAVNAVVQAGGAGSNTDFEYKEVSSAAVHRQLAEVYGNDVMNGQSMVK